MLDSKHGFVSMPEYNCRTTTIAWLNRQSKFVAHERLMDIAKHNVQSIKNVIMHLSTLPESLRMFRISSDLLPAFTHDSYIPFYTDSQNQKLLEKWFGEAGSLAKKHNIRLSFHPDQFCCIASDSDEIVAKSINELEYHATIAKWMGYGQSKLDFKINIHLSGRRREFGLDLIWNKISPELRNTLTLENDEYQTGIDDLIKLKDKVGIVLDIHHHFIHTGEYIQNDDDRIKHIVDSWCGVRPTIHYSVSREEHLPNHDINILPNLKSLIEQGSNRQKLRAHSDYMWNVKVNDWAKSHWEWADVLVEAKAKNLASFKLYESWVS
jgi:UV DNA damage repair endonuclease